MNDAFTNEPACTKNTQHHDEPHRATLLRMVRQSLEDWAASGVTRCTEVPRVMPRTRSNTPANPNGNRTGNASDTPRQTVRPATGSASMNPPVAVKSSPAPPQTATLGGAGIGAAIRPSRVLPTDVELAAIPDRAAALAVIDEKVCTCRRCVELATTRTQTVFGVGTSSPRLIFMGEAPGADEDLQGEPFVGRAGRMLTDMIEKGMRLSRADVFILNTLKCRPPGNRTPLPAEAACCREFLDAQIAVLRPEFICCLGAVAAQSLLGVSTPISKLRGGWHTLGPIRVLCTYHPAYLLRNPPAKKDVWADLQILMREMGIPVIGR